MKRNRNSSRYYSYHTRNRTYKRRIRESRGSDISLSPISVDKQIDSLLIAFQDDSAEVDSDQVVPEGITSMHTALLLLEAEEEQEDTTSTVTSDSDKRAESPGAAMVPKLNIDDFASKVATLINTASKRLDVETVILNRAKNFISDEYGSEIGNQLIELLTDTHGIDLDGTDDDEGKGDHYAVGATGPSL